MTPHASRLRWIPVALRIALIGLASWALWRDLAGLNTRDLLVQLRSYHPGVIALGIAATTASFLSLGVLEILALRYVRAARTIPTGTALTTAFVANAMSQSIGIALLTGTAVRLRAYRQYALAATDVARISAFVTASVSLGLLAAGGGAFLVSSEPLIIWSFALQVRIVGAVLVAVVAAYLAWSAIGTHESVGRGAWRIARPSSGLATQQIVVSAFDWIVTGSILYLVLPSSLGVDYGTALRVYLVAQTVGTLSHVPGGAGVFELLVLTLLAPITTVAQRPAIVASLVMFRVIYYLLPLIAGCLVAGIAELRAPSRVGTRGMANVA